MHGVEATLRARGFSLIEMLVALAVFSLALLGLLNLAGENTRTATIIQERVLAGVVADNRAVEAMTEPPQQLAQATSGVEAAGDLQWEWLRTLHGTDDPDLLRVDIQVRPQGETRIAAELSLFRRVEP